MEKAENFLQQAAEAERMMVEHVGTPKGDQIKLKLGFLSTYPATAHMLKLRKSRSKMVLGAMNTGIVERGNVGVQTDRVYGVPGARHVYFTYRGTAIMTWDLNTNTVTDVDAGDFEHTPSTFNQRKLARESIDELRKAIGAL